MVKAMYIFLQKKSNPDIVSYSTERNINHVKQYIKKINFYLPVMQKLNKDMNPEDFPQKSLYIFNSPCTMCDYVSLCDETYEEDFIIENKNIEKLYLAPTDIISFETCPRAWAYRKSGIYPIKKKATIEVGTCIHKAIETFLLENRDPVEIFQLEWDQTCSNYTMDFNKKESPELLREIGSICLKKFPEFWEKQNLEVLSVEERNYIDFGNFVFSGKWDLLCKNKDNENIIIDFKFSSPHNEEQVIKWLDKSDQITGYALLWAYKNKIIKLEDLKGVKNGNNFTNK